MTSSSSIGSSEGSLLRKGEIVGGQWTVLHYINKGLQAEIYHAKCHSAKSVAIKIHFKYRRSTMQKEYGIYKRIENSFPTTPFVRAYHIGQHKGYEFMVMDLLGQLMFNPSTPTPTPPDMRTVFRWIRQLIEQLQAIHDVGYLHGDLHFANVVHGHSDKGNADSVLLIDFGLAFKFRNDDGSLVPGTEVSLSINHELRSILKLFIAFLADTEIPRNNGTQGM